MCQFLWCFVVIAVAFSSATSWAFSGENACEKWESSGNREATHSQRCSYQTNQGGHGMYSLTFGGDYGDKYMLLAVYMINKLEELDRSVPNKTDAIAAAFPSHRLANGAPTTFRVSMADVRSCRKEPSDVSQRICLSQKIVSSMLEHSKR